MIEVIVKGYINGSNDKVIHDMFSLSKASKIDIILTVDGKKVILDLDDINSTVETVNE